MSEMTCPRCGGAGVVDATLGDRIVLFRKRKKITQEELSAAIGLSRAQIANIESGRVSTTIKNIIAIADFFNITTDKLLLGD